MINVKAETMSFGQFRTIRMGDRLYLLMMDNGATYSPNATVTVSSVSVDPVSGDMTLSAIGRWYGWPDAEIGARCDAQEHGFRIIPPESSGVQ